MQREDPLERFCTELFEAGSGAGDLFGGAKDGKLLGWWRGFDVRLNFLNVNAGTKQDSSSFLLKNGHFLEKKHQRLEEILPEKNRSSKVEKPKWPGFWGNLF